MPLQNTGVIQAKNTELYKPRILAIQAENTELYKPRIPSYTSQEYRVIQAKNTGVIQAKNTELYKPRIQSYTSQEYRAHLHSDVVTHVVPDVDKQGKH